MKITKVIPGLLLCIAIAFLARWLTSLMPIHLIGSSIVALFIGMLLHPLIESRGYFKAGLKFTSKKILRIAIILLGASLSLSTILSVGRLSLVVMFFTLLTCFGGGHFIGKFLGLDWKLSNMISAGTGICGGSAIAAMAPVIRANDKDIAYAMSATFIFDMAMILLFPIMGKLIGLDDMAFGLWAGTAVNDTSSVVAAGYAFSEPAGDFATMVKLTRTLAIIPTVLIFSLIYIKKSVTSSTDANLKKVNILSLFPWFILAFVFMAILNSMGFISLELSSKLKDLSRFLMVAALAAIGMGTNFKELKKAGMAPMFHGLIISTLVVIVAFIVIYTTGLV
jgi:uncharacterized integral membrane protein (TIGR00698 family)